jgi:hypothetical protein
MKRLAAVCVVLLVLGVSAQAYGYVLVYNLYGAVHTVDTAADQSNLKIVVGYMVLDVDTVTGTAEASSVIFYGGQRRGGVYTVNDDIVNLAKYGSYVTVMMDTGLGNSFVLTGRISTRGNGLAERLGEAGSLIGAMSLKWAMLFDPNESLVGAGAMQAMLNNPMTRTANSSADRFAQTVDSIIANLEAMGYQELAEEEPPPGEPLPG